MKKRLIPFVLFSLASALSHACPVDVSETTTEIVKSHGGWQLSDEQCAFLARNHLYLNVESEATVLSGISIGWAVVKLDNEHNITAEKSSSSTHVNSGVASQDTAEDLAYAAIGDAIKGLDFEASLEQIKKFKAEIKKFGP